MVSLKKALTYEEQVDHLINYHKLLVPDRDQAIYILRSVNYYRLSAYGIGLKKRDCPEDYMDGVSINTLYRLYTFDSRFRNLLIHTIEQIEIRLRTQIANYLALTYDPECYMDASYFDDKSMSRGGTVHSNIISHFKDECARQNNVPFVRHHKINYSNHFPIWVAVELFTFGNLTSLYSIMKPDDKKAISRQYNTEPRYLQSWILALTEVRNICAHYGRLYNMPLKQSPHLYKENKKYRNGRNNKIFPVILCIKRMLLEDPDLWNKFSLDLIGLVEEYRDVVRLSYMDFPKEWKAVLMS